MGQKSKRQNGLLAVGGLNRTHSPTGHLTGDNVTQVRTLRIKRTRLSVWLA